VTSWIKLHSSLLARALSERNQWWMPASVNRVARCELNTYIGAVLIPVCLLKIRVRTDAAAPLAAAAWEKLQKRNIHSSPNAAFRRSEAF
jgi:hypothetical protein